MLLQHAVLWIVDISAWNEHNTSIPRIEVVSLKDQYPPTRLFPVTTKRWICQYTLPWGRNLEILLTNKSNRKRIEPYFPGWQLNTLWKYIYGFAFVIYQCANNYLKLIFRSSVNSTESRPINEASGWTKLLIVAGELHIWGNEGSVLVEILHQY